MLDVYTHRIRINEFFRDYDPHNCGHITVNQFFAAIAQLGLPLDQHERKIIHAQFCSSDGRMKYREFTSSVNACNVFIPHLLVFTMEGLETDPLKVVEPPKREFLVQVILNSSYCKNVNQLSSQEEERLEKILAYMRKVVSERRLLLAPLFKDFDKHLGNLGKITRAHFCRILSTVNLLVSEEDLVLLFKKYEGKSPGRIHYMEFVRAVDPDSK